MVIQQGDRVRSLLNYGELGTEPLTVIEVTTPASNEALWPNPNKRPEFSPMILCRTADGVRCSFQPHKLRKIEPPKQLALAL